MSASGRVVVCIEDDLEVIELAGVILKPKGFEFIGAVGGREGLETVRRVKPDVVLLDLMMPEIDGWEVFRQMKADQELKSIPVIVITADGQPITKVLGLHVAKVDAFITKPFSPKQLVQTISDVINARSVGASA